MLARVLQGTVLQGVELRRNTKDGTPIDLQLSVAPLHGSNGEIVGSIAVVADITEQKTAEAALRHQASHDGLTNLPNRTTLHENLDRVLQRARSTGQPVSLLLLDLDRFKEVNDALGHHVGDILLRQVAGRLQQAIGASETLARLGGDEFALILPAADGAAARDVGRLVLQSLEPHFQVEQHLLDIGCSIGIAVYPEHGTDVPTLLRHADAAMYVAKRAQSGIGIYDPVHDQHAVRRLLLHHDLRHAIRDEGLHLHYQPKITLATGLVCGAEVLLRWSHPVHGFIPPIEFIPLAESSGLIIPLTDWVLMTALAQAGSWRKAGHSQAVAVNLSTRGLQDAKFPAVVASLLDRYQVAPEHLTLEITESTLMADPLGARAVLTQLHALGIRMAIDDFGTGYSSLGYLKELPVDEVKIDKTFVQGMGAGDQKDAAIVRSVVAMAHALGLAVVAEGVEDASTYALLKELGCDVAQGYYLSRPQPTADFERWLQRYVPML